MSTLKKEKLTDSPNIFVKLNWTWAHTFVFLQIVSQLLLLVPQVGHFRFLLRISCFSMSLLLLAFLPAKGPKHPAHNAAIIIIVIMLLEFGLHPNINSINAGIVHCLMYIAIIGPIFWVRSLKITPTGFESLLFIMWGFNTLSAIFGVLQVYYPGQFQPPLAEAIKNNAFGGTDLLISLANGAKVYRPMGLSDTPGGAGGSGYYAFLFGIGFALKSKNFISQIIYIVSAILGLFCIYLCQIRAVLVVCGVSIIFLALVLLIKKQFAQLTVMLPGVTAMFLATFYWATAIGGKGTKNRLSSLTSSSADKVYHQGRGEFLQEAFDTVLPQFPLGGGLGRWGMINGYFGDNTDLDSLPFWVEIQWTGWIVDGGIFMLLAYPIALFITCQTTGQIALNTKVPEFSIWSTLIFGYNIGAIALTFSYPLFISQGGMEFWLLNSALFIAASNSKVPPMLKSKNAQVYSSP